MSRNLELPDDVYESLERTAREVGVSPVDWIELQLPKPSTNGCAKTADKGAAKLERLKHIIGSIDSGGANLSQNTGEQFTEYLLQKKREGRL
jgi:hypothetical protein